MTEKEINLKSVLFLVIGLLLLLSLVICIYIVNGEKDLVSIEAKVLDVQKDENGTGKNNITVSYDIDDTSYNYNFNYKDNIEKNDIITIYYHKNNISSVTTFKTTKLIFICPVIGLILCVISLFELFRQGKEDILFQTAVIDVSGLTQKLEIVTDDTIIKEYQQLPEEQVETEVKTIKKISKNNRKEESKKNISTPKPQSKENSKDDWYIEVNNEQQDQSIIDKQTIIDNQRILDNHKIDANQDIKDELPKNNIKNIENQQISNNK